VFDAAADNIMVDTSNCFGIAIAKCLSMTPTITPSAKRVRIGSIAW
jgi:hypothetical protein